jgi:curved DNA-binding protein CbpA
MDVERKRVLAHLLTMFYVLGVVYTISYTYATLPENHYQFFGASCEHLNVVDLKRQFRIAAKIYHPDKAGQEATDNFVRVRVAYDILKNDTLREIYNRFGIFLSGLDLQHSAHLSYAGVSNRLASDYDCEFGSRLNRGHLESCYALQEHSLFQQYDQSFPSPLLHQHIISLTTLLKCKN